MFKGMERDRSWCCHGTNHTSMTENRGLSPVSSLPMGPGQFSHLKAKEIKIRYSLIACQPPTVD